MDIPHDDAAAFLARHGDALRFEVRNDVGYGGMRWITVGHVGRRSPASPTMSAAPSPR